MKTIVECVPNFSEGRDRKVVGQIIAAILSVPGLCLMDQEMDADHNRSVITFVGEKERVGEGALRAMGKAAELIDLNKHVGAHPRIGATDVVPFIPVRNVSLEECVTIARQVGEEAVRRYGIPVYLYEAAATRPERVQLENLRKGQFEGLRHEIEINPDRRPDFGPPKIHPTAGATVVGARKFLIAYNINLNTPDLSIAKQIAKTIRFSSGGLPYVKAMGVDLKARGLAQVSMNLTDYEQTPVHRIFEIVKQEAQRYNASIVGSEIIGLIPQKALEMASEFYLQVEEFRPEMIFENRLAQIMAERQELASLPVADFLAAVSNMESVPGGGSVAALAGALSAALGKMVVGFSRSKKEAEAHRAELERQMAVCEKCLADLQAAIQQDSTAYAGVEAALRMPKMTDEEKEARRQALQSALKNATVVPQLVAENAVTLMKTLAALKPIANPNLMSDLNTGYWMAFAAAKGALENVAINLKSIKDTAFVSQTQAAYDAIASFLGEAIG